MLENLEKNVDSFFQPTPRTRIIIQPKILHPNIILNDR